MSFDAAIIPGGGVRDDRSLHPWVVRRFDRALALLPNGPFLALSGGTHHKPAPILEAYAGARYLLSRGVSPEKIYTEVSSYDTIGNAFFARVQHCDVRGWRRLLVVNSEFHMPRTRAIFEWMFALVPERGYELTFESTTDDGMSPEDLRDRKAREAASLAAFRETAKRFGSMADVHGWLYAEHAAYRADSATADRVVDPNLARLY